MEIEIPYNFEYRDYQKWVVSFLRNWWKRAVNTWHRRAWKDKTYFNICIEMALREVWGYVYILPTYTQGKKVIWDSIDKEWKRFRDHIPKELLVWENGTELKFTLANGSFIQVLGSDNIDSIRWTSPRWIVFSEYAFQNPTVWDVMRPILAENWWWAIFNSTPNGKNHFYDMCQMAKDSPDWYYQKLSIEDTWMVDIAYINQERAQWMMEEMIQQEYYCSFEVWALWSFYADLMSKAENEWRITQLPKTLSAVDIYFDLWRNDQTSVWFKQNDWLWFNFIHYYEWNWKHITKYFDYIDEYIESNKLQINKLHFPHDSKQEHIEAEKSSLQLAQDRYWHHKVHYIERTIAIQKDRDRVRELLPRCRFDKDAASQWIKCLENYHKKWDDKKKIFLNDHEHDWASHWSDSFRYFAVTEKDILIPIESKPRTYFNRKTWKIENVIN